MDTPIITPAVDTVTPEISRSFFQKHKISLLISAIIILITIPLLIGSSKKYPRAVTSYTPPASTISPSVIFTKDTVLPAIQTMQEKIQSTSDSIDEEVTTATQSDSTKDAIPGL